jgi:hypothetical protein
LSNKYFILFKIQKLNKIFIFSFSLNLLGIGDWGLGIGGWAQSPNPIPNPHSPIPNAHDIIIRKVLVFNSYIDFYQ